MLLSCVGLLDFLAKEGSRESPVLRIALRTWKEWPSAPRELADEPGISFLSCEMFPLLCSDCSLRLPAAEGLQKSGVQMLPLP